MTKAKRKNVPASLRQAAAALSMSRKKLLRMIRDGMSGVSRKAERVYIDVEAARQWIADNESQDGPRRAPVLNPADPRHAERTASARIKAIKLALATGNMVRVEDAAMRAGSEFGELRSGLLEIHTRLAHEMQGATADEAERLIGAAVEDVLQALKSDSMSAWPTPTAPAAPDDDGDDWLEGGEPEYLPLLTSGDPRHAFALAAAQTRQHELASLESEVVPLSVALEIAAEEYGIVREAVRAIPFSVALSLSNGPNDQATVESALRRDVYAVLCEFSGTEPSAQIDTGDDLDSLPFEDVDGIGKAQSQDSESPIALSADNT